jgi:hypothetical protein
MKVQLFSIDSSETGEVEFWNGGTLIVTLGAKKFWILVGNHFVTQNYRARLPFALAEDPKAVVEFSCIEILGKQAIAVKVDERRFVGSFEEFDQNVRKILGLDVVEVMQLHGFVE